MLDDPVLAALHARLSAALAYPTGHYLPLRVDQCSVGWLDTARAKRVLRFTDVFERTSEGIGFERSLDTAASRSHALQQVVRMLAAEGLLTRWRDEAYAVGKTFGGPPLFEIERAAARYFGIVTYAAHVNGLVEGGGVQRMWIARRSPTKAIDPDQLDNLVGGGIRAGTTVAQTVQREAWEEAGIDPVLAHAARPAGVVRICRAQPDGLHRDVIYVHDLALPQEFVPAAQDDEVAEHRLMLLQDVATLIAHGDGQDLVTADASLVILDFLIRRGGIAPDSSHYLALSELRWPALDPPR